ncbi:hypothetical protein OG455_28945 [Kitasatospora sp. NBC_01287]|uniref:hypothetical protein n=1 Tax=Kitasatospora sp. NBC_01287 TaxID=2903573 RepID=UPI00225BFA5F|nr:hypothetical protein [Kitasatospora sp. NBC_01287]MCX4749491.1 hypothetical protein [Kitasatospora sp. NBC_01287]
MDEQLIEVGAQGNTGSDSTTVYLEAPTGPEAPPLTDDSSACDPLPTSPQSARGADRADQAWWNAAKNSPMAGVANAIRGALKKSAREQRTTSWDALHQRTGHKLLPTLSHLQKTQVLALVDQSTAIDEPLLSVLVTDETGESLQLHREVAQRLGRDVPADDQALLAHLEGKITDLHRQWQQR